MSERARRVDGFHLVSGRLGTDGAPMLAARDASTSSSFARHDVDSENGCVVVGLVPLMVGLVGIGRAVASLRLPRAPIA